jgi:hypothetical protein
MRRRLALVLCAAAGCEADGILVEMDDRGGDDRQQLEEGEIVRFGDAELIVPPPGEGVGLVAETEDGGWILLELTHGDDGFTTIRAEVPGFLEGEELEGPDLDVDPGVLQSALAPAACADQAYVRTGRKWASTMSWRFKSGSTPSGLDVVTVETVLKRSAANITGARNDCGRADAVSAQNSYLGRTSAGISVSTTSNGVITCGTRDGKSVVGFGSLTGFKAATCWYWNASNALVEADIKFNSGTKWILTTTIPSGCTNALHFESVATHEFGHAFGLNHPGTSHPNLTMQPGNACDNSKRTLGLGDMLGLEKLY